MSEQVRTRSITVTDTPATTLGALLALAVVVIHVIDQGGVPGTKTPTYVGIGYWILEIVGVLTALVLLLRRRRLGWLLSLGVAAGPLVGYVLSRGPGLPNYSDDIGNWTEPLGVISVVIESVLFVLAAFSLVAAVRARRVSDLS